MILCFHEIGDQQNPYCITISQFEKVIKEHPDAEIHFDDGRKGIMSVIPILKELKRKATVFLVPRFLEGIIPNQEKYSGFLDKSNVQELVNAGFEIGSHSYSHKDLTAINQTELDMELIYSKKYLERIFNVPVTKFALPFGRVNAYVANEARKIYSKVYSLESDLAIQRKLVISANS